MEFFKSTYRYLNVAAAIAMVALLAACSIVQNDKDDVEEGIASTLSVTITKSYADATDDTPSSELIQNWWIAFVNQSTGEIIEIVSRSQDNSQNESQDESNVRPDAVQWETFTTTLPSGTYTLYAFANIGLETSDTGNISYSIATSDGESYIFTKGSLKPEGIDDAIYGKPLPAFGSIVPMTGKATDIVVRPLESNNIVVEVVRLFAKFNFKFRSDASEEIKVKSVKIIPASTQFVPLFPDYKKLDDHTAPEILPGAVTEDYLYTFPTPVSVPGGTEASAAVAAPVYVFESTAKDYESPEGVTIPGHATGHYVLQFDVEDSKFKTHQMNALLYELEHVYRNDMINIPVCLTDWKVDLDIRFYPPIGGYPTVVVHSDGDQFNASFGSSGLFVIKPIVSDLKNNELGYNSFTCEIVVESDPYNILASHTLSLNEASEIEGEINIGKTGTAVLNLNFQVNDDQLAHIFVRKLSIIR